MNKRIISFCVLALLWANANAQEEEQQQEAEQLPEVVLSDSRFALKRENSGKTVVKISSEELAQNQGKTVAEVINSKSGIEIVGSRSNAGQNLGNFVRGGNNRQALVIIDGIQVSDPSAVNAEFDLRLLSLSQIESIEILKGAASTLYGNAAATAVINITTKKAKQDGISATFDSSIGTNQSQDDDNYSLTDFSNSVTISGKKDKFSALAGFGHQYTEGLSAVIGEERDPFSRINANVKLGYRFSDDLSVSVFGNFDKFRSNFDNSFPVEDAPFFSESEQLRVGISPKYVYNNGSITLNAAYNSIERATESTFPSQFDSKSFVVDLFNKYTFNSSLYTIVGVNYIQNKTEFSDEAEATTIDPYANAVYVSDFGLNINAGARLNNHSEYGTNLTYNINPSYSKDVGEGYVKVFGSYATSFIAPNLSQLFGPFGPNPDLDPETNITIEGGLEYKVNDKLRASALYFNRKEKDFIDYVILDFTTFAGEYQNIDEEFTVQGVEVEVFAQPLEKLSVNANYTFTEKQDVVTLRLPKHKINATIGYDFCEATFASLSYQYNGERTDRDFSTFSDVDLDSYGLLDLYVSHKFLKNKMKVFANVSNILNEEYTEIIGFTTRGRNVRLGLSLTL